MLITLNRLPGSNMMFCEHQLLSHDCASCMNRAHRHQLKFYRANATKIVMILPYLHFLRHKTMFLLYSPKLPRSGAGLREIVVDAALRYLSGAGLGCSKPHVLVTLQLFHAFPSPPLSVKHQIHPTLLG